MKRIVFCLFLVLLISQAAFASDILKPFIYLMTRTSGPTRPGAIWYDGTNFQLVGVGGTSNPIVTGTGFDPSSNQTITGDWSFSNSLPVGSKHLLNSVDGTFCTTTIVLHAGSSGAPPPTNGAVTYCGNVGAVPAVIMRWEDANTAVVFNGKGSLGGCISAIGSIFIGDKAGSSITGAPSLDVVLGYGAAQNALNVTNSVVIGGGAYNLGSDSYGDVAIGYQALEKGAATYNVAIGFQAGSHIANVGDDYNIAIGYQSMGSHHDASGRDENIAIGHGSMSISPGTTECIAIGHNTLGNSPACSSSHAQYCIAIGNAAIRAYTVDLENVIALGRLAGNGKSLSNQFYLSSSSYPVHMNIYTDPVTDGAVYVSFNDAAYGLPLMSTDGTLTVTGPLVHKGYDTYSADASPGTTVDHIYIDADSNDVTVSLTPVDGGKWCIIAKTDPTGNTITIQGATGNINGAGTYTNLDVQYEQIDVHCDGTDFYAASKQP